MSAGIILVHGYSGSPEDLKPLARQLSLMYKSGSVANIRLPWHGAKDEPVFDKQAFLNCISDAVNPYVREKRKIIILGHSTGGILALSFLLEHSFVPHMLILASVPKIIDSAYAERWQKHRLGKKDIPFDNVARMVSLINNIGLQQFKGAFPVLIVHGEKDDLVLPGEAYAWKRNFHGPTRLAVIPHAGHSIFREGNGAVATDFIVRAISDVVAPKRVNDRKALEALSEVEPEADAFITASPFSGRHLAASPSGQSLVNDKPLLSPVVKKEPVLANIEITTRCNLKCAYCARSVLKRQGSDMPKEMFSRVLDLLPHAYRITIVGLGEPLLHPNIIDFVSEVSSRRRRAAIVTNAMFLDKSMSFELIKAGLNSIAFSIDGPTQETAFEARPGSDINKIVANMKMFMEISKSTRPLSTAVFTAVSRKTIPHLEELVDLVKSLGVNVLMLTDLNFAQNRANTLCENADDHTAMIVKKAISSAFSKKLPVLSVRGLEEFGMTGRYGKFLLLPPNQLYRRSLKRTWCYSPWQTVPVDVEGNITVCDCQPDKRIGNLLSRPFSGIWNGKAITEYRRQMLGGNPPETCRICPRF